VLELMGSQAGGIPFVRKRWAGHTSDTQIFQQRAEALLRAFQDTPSPRYLVADAKLYCADHATSLAQLGFVTRLPAALKVVSQVMSPALQWDTWPPFDHTPRYQPLRKLLNFQALFCAASYNIERGFSHSPRGTFRDFLHPLTTLRVDGKKAWIPGSS
jgi:hypothetical protein